MQKRTITVALMLALAACTPNTKTASKETFAAAAQKYLDAHPMCQPVNFIPPEKLPGYVMLPPNFFSDSTEPPKLENLLKQSRHARINAFLTLGFISVEVKSLKTDTGNDFVLALDFTAKGRAFANPNQPDAAMFCYAKAKVVEVTQFTEPTESNGVTVSQVAYTTELTDIQPWAKIPELNIHLKTEPQIKSGEFVLTGEGWAANTFGK